jgi:SAM-dependent methyltransferase
MALYDLVSLKQHLVGAVDATPAVAALTEIRDRINGIKSAVNNIDSKNIDYIDSLVSHYDQLIAEAQRPIDEFVEYKKDIDQQITDLTHKIFAGNYELESRMPPIDNIRKFRKINVSADIAFTVAQRILLYTNWRYPALEIGCRDGEWTHNMIAADPLYIVDRYQEFLTSASSQFNESYQRRLRPYLMVDNNLDMLPANQFGFIFSWGYCNYISLDSMTQLLRKVFDLLRPGGVFLFTFNDGDTPGGAGMAESFAQTYMPKSILIPTARGVGFEIHQEFDYSPTVTWLEIKKPGTLQTIKAHQVLGKIMRI